MKKGRKEGGREGRAEAACRRMEEEKKDMEAEEEEEWSGRRSRRWRKR